MAIFNLDDDGNDGIDSPLQLIGGVPDDSHALCNVRGVGVPA